MNKSEIKPLGIKAYGSIPHLPGSRMGPADRHCHEGQARIATEKARDKNDRIIVQEKLDGACVAVAKVDGDIIPLGRAGYPAWTSPHRHIIMFHEWVYTNYERFDALLGDGERVVGEWLAMAHGTRYDLTGREPFVAFDLMFDQTRMPFGFFETRMQQFGIATAPVLCDHGPASIDLAIHAISFRQGKSYGLYGALDPVEGAVWRVERNGIVDFLVKYVRPDKVDGCYFPEVTGGTAVWNWLPEGVSP